MTRIVLLAMALLAGCSAPRQVSKTAPTPKEAIRLLMSLRDLPLKALPTCKSAGTSPDDKDLGDYVSGWMSELKSGKGSNWIDTSTQEEEIPAEHDRGWRCTIYFRHVDGEDRWGWGVSFVVRGADRTPILDSVRCLGAG